jgi:hypothetical protein
LRVKPAAPIEPKEAISELYQWMRRLPGCAWNTRENLPTVWETCVKIYIVYLCFCSNSGGFLKLGVESNLSWVTELTRSQDLPARTKWPRLRGWSRLPKWDLSKPRLPGIYLSIFNILGWEGTRTFLREAHR